MIISNTKFRIFFHGMRHQISIAEIFRRGMSSDNLSTGKATVRTVRSSPTISSDSSHGKRIASLLLHENVKFLDVIPLGLEFLDLTIANASDERLSICVERIRASVKADALKQELFDQAVCNISKTRDQNGTAIFCESVLKYSKPPPLDVLRKSLKSALDWADTCLAKFQNPDPLRGSEEPARTSVNRDFDGMAQSLAATDSWHHNVWQAKKSLLKVLGSQVVRS
jgi:hypothetical protein